MSDTEQQSFQAWLRGHFKFDSHDLAEISNLIAVPGLPDVDMPDVLSLLAEDDEIQQPISSQEAYFQSRISPDSTAAAATSSMQWPTVQADKAAPSQGMAQAWLPPAGDADVPTLAESQLAFQLQPHSFLQPPEAGLYNSEQQQPQLMQTPLQQLDWTQSLDHPVVLYSQLEAAANSFVAAAPDTRSVLPTDKATVSSFAGLTFQDLYNAQPQAANPAAASQIMADPQLSMQQPGICRGAITSSGEFDVSQSSSQSHGKQTKHTRHPAAGKHPAGVRVGSRRVSAATTAPVGAGLQEGVAKRRKRKPSDAQRAAHRRFRQRRKEQMVTLEQEVAAKQAQLQALSLEHLALEAKARALDQLVASAGDGMALLQQLEQLSISQKQQQQQQYLIKELQGNDCQQQQQLSVTSDNEASPASSSIVVSGTSSVGVTSSDGVQQHQPQLSTPGPETSSPSSPEAKQQQQQFEQEQLVRAGSIRGSMTYIDGHCCSEVGSGTLQRQLLVQESRANTVGSIEHLEARLKTILTLPTHETVRFLHQSDRMRVQDELPKLKTLLKSFVREVMQLLLQIGQETGQGGSVGAGPSPAEHLLNPLNHKAQQEVAAVDLGLLLQQQALGSNQASAVVAAATGGGGNIAASPTYARLQYLLTQTTNEFRKFAAINRISLYHAHTLNLETGSLGVHPPDGHWKRVALLMKDKVPQQVLSDICVAGQLYRNAVGSITQQRRMLFMELQRLLDRDGKGGYRTLQVMTDLHGIHGEGVAILDAIDTNMRKEYALEGVFQWMVRKLMSPLSSAEILVHSYPYIPEFHCILSELVQMAEQVPALTALQELQLQQLNSMGNVQQQQHQEVNVGWIDRPLPQQTQQQHTQESTTGYDVSQQQSILGQPDQLPQQPPLLTPSIEQEPPAVVVNQLQPSVDAAWQAQHTLLQPLPVEPWEQQPQHQQSGFGLQGQLSAASMWSQEQQQQQVGGDWLVEQQLVPAVSCQDDKLRGVDVLQTSAPYAAPAVQY